MGITLRIILGNVERLEFRHFVNDNADVIDNNFTILVTLKQEELARIFVIMSVNCCHWNFFFDAHIV